LVQRGLRDLETVRRLMNSAKGTLEAGQVKTRMEKLGFRFAMSLYGVLKNRETGQHSYRRIEVMSNNVLAEKDVELLYRWFQKMFPYKTYTIWAYDTEQEKLLEVFSTW